MSCFIWDVSSSTKSEQWLRVGQRPIFSKEGKRNSLLLILMRQPRVKLNSLSGKVPHICYFMEKFFGIFWDRVSSARSADPLPLLSKCWDYRCALSGSVSVESKLVWEQECCGLEKKLLNEAIAHTKKLENILCRKKLEDTNRMT